MTAAILQSPSKLDEAIQLAFGNAQVAVPSPAAEQSPSAKRRQRVTSERNQARIHAEKTYRERRIKATNGDYDEDKESSLVRNLPEFFMDEIFCGEKLGNGAFGTVYEVGKVKLDDDETDQSNQAGRKFIAQHCLRDDKNCNAARYAIKKLRTKIVNGESGVFMQALIDAATETRLLAALPHHPNIIKLRGVVSSRDIHDENYHKSFPSYCFHEDYCLILDRLYGTLEDRLEHWSQLETPKGRLGMLSLKKRKQGNLLTVTKSERLTACHDLASALSHMHMHGIIHRDIKPPNIGFNIRGDLTIFDFGLSRELPAPDEDNNDENHYNNKLFKMTKFCGSPRYMAPEIGLGEGYNAKSDVYSFGLLAWQIMTLQQPWEGCRFNDLKKTIWPATGNVTGPCDWTPKKSSGGGSGSRSRLFGGKPKPIAGNPRLARMIDRTFDRCIDKRPTMREVYNFLKRECLNNSSHGIHLRPSGRRSTYVLNAPDLEKLLLSTPAKPHPHESWDNTHHGFDISTASGSSSFSEDVDTS
jgi:serine/threonine protein kinase